MVTSDQRLHRVVYTSRLCEDQADVEDQVVARIVDSARRNNPRRGVTGVLVHGKGAFAQVLEGRPLVVRGLLTVIQRDTRHTDMRVVKVDVVEDRIFPSWSMALLRDLDEVPAEFAAGNASLLMLMRLRTLLHTGELGA
ncbi:BLUF domain-containing protein [Roseomonas stagni]|uniref:BLUF domain-containing protein n=1 Tax=Falsiroseomonas algicola TaxID=2716930 RepID=A0A6M1LH63_9PROT|nr:BLUF domain-containing protein [Falsiroseomonas algicola]NGM19462.1 BLUF domain-containing protein [Falsiroseomonas algicola]